MCTQCIISPAGCHLNQSSCLCTHSTSQLHSAGVSNCPNTVDVLCLRLSVYQCRQSCSAASFTVSLSLIQIIYHSFRLPPPSSPHLSPQPLQVSSLIIFSHLLHFLSSQTHNSQNAQTQMDPTLYVWFFLSFPLCPHSSCPERQQLLYNSFKQYLIYFWISVNIFKLNICLSTYKIESHFVHLKWKSIFNNKQYQ